MSVRSYIEVRGNVGFLDGDFAIGIVNAVTGQRTVPPLAFTTPEAAQSVVDAIVAAAPELYRPASEKRYEE